MAVKVAVVTNFDCRLGFSIVKGLSRKFKGKIFVTAPSECLCLEAAKKLNLEPENCVVVIDRSSLENFAAFLAVKYGGIDVLVNNNSVKPHADFPTYEEATQTVSSIYQSMLTIQEVLYPLLKDGSRVVNISSCYGHLSNLRNKDWLEKIQNPDLTVDEINIFVENYLESVKNHTFDAEDFSDDGKQADFKVATIALTALTFVQQREYAGRNISINAYNSGLQSPDDAAKGPLYLILDASENLKGTFMWEDKKLVDWYDFEGDYCNRV